MDELKKLFEAIAKEKTRNLELQKEEVLKGKSLTAKKSKRISGAYLRASFKNFQRLKNKIKINYKS